MRHLFVPSQHVFSQLIYSRSFRKFPIYDCKLKGTHRIFQKEKCYVVVLEEIKESTPSNGSRKQAFVYWNSSRIHEIIFKSSVLQVLTSSFPVGFPLLFSTIIWHHLAYLAVFSHIVFSLLYNISMALACYPYHICCLASMHPHFFLNFRPSCIVQRLRRWNCGHGG